MVQHDPHLPAGLSLAVARSRSTCASRTVLGHTFTAGYYEWRGVRYVPSWGGSMFEALMPTLVLDESAPGAAQPGPQRPRARRRPAALRRARPRPAGVGLLAQRHAGQRSLRRVRRAGSRLARLPPGPVTPHASAPRLWRSCRTPRCANLRRLARALRVYGEYGFYDAVDPRTGQVAYKYLTLDQSMIFLALANHLADHAVQRRFAADPIMQRVLPLLAGGGILRLTASSREVRTPMAASPSSTSRRSTRTARTRRHRLHAWRSTTAS